MDALDKMLGKLSALFNHAYEKSIIAYYSDKQLVKFDCLNFIKRDMEDAIIAIKEYRDQHPEDFK